MTLLMSVETYDGYTVELYHTPESDWLDYEAVMYGHDNHGSVVARFDKKQEGIDWMHAQQRGKPFAGLAFEPIA